MASGIVRFVCAALLGCSTAAFAQSSPLVVGAVVSQTGAHADLADHYRKGLLLWQDEVNAAGGLLGRQVELVVLDDRSEATRAGALYVELIRKHKADALIGPYGTAATMSAAAEAESARRVMINGAGWSRAVHRRSPRYVFQSCTPYNAFGIGVLELARAQGLRKVAIFARDDLAAREMAAGAVEAARRLGLQAGEVVVYSGDTSDFESFVAKVRAAEPDAWVAFGEPRDAAEMVKTFKRLGYAPRLFFVSGAAERKWVLPLGQDAERAMGAAAYDPRFATEGNERFVKAFSAKWSVPPGRPAAEAYAAASVLAEGLRRAGSPDPDKLRAAIAGLAMRTVLGEFKVDRATGEQLGTAAAVTQIQKSRPQIVWPQALETGKALPYPQWGEREYQK